MQFTTEECYICAGEPYPKPQLKHGFCTGCISKWYSTTTSVCSQCKADIESLKLSRDERTKSASDKDITVTKMSDTLYRVSNGLGNVFTNVKDLDKVIKNSKDQLDLFNGRSSKPKNYGSKTIELGLAVERQFVHANHCEQE